MLKQLCSFFSVVVSAAIVSAVALTGGCISDVASAPVAPAADAGTDTNPCPAADSIKAGVACAPEGLACSGHTCCGGRWVPDVLKDLCPKSSVVDSGVVSSEAGSGATDTAPPPVPPVGSVKATIVVKAGLVDGKPADHVYIQGELVAEGDLRPAGTVTVYTSWGSLGCDAFKSSADLVCTVSIPPGMDSRYQVFVQRGSQVLYSCGTVATTLDPATTQTASVEGVGEVKPDFATNVAGPPYADCQVGRKSAKK